MTESFPLRWLAHDSAWKIPQVELKIPANTSLIGLAVESYWGDLPLPTPLMTRPTMSWGKEYAENWRMAPMILIMAPVLRVFLRPKVPP